VQTNHCSAAPSDFFAGNFIILYRKYKKVAERIPATGIPPAVALVSRKSPIALSEKPANF